MAEQIPTNADDFGLTHQQLTAIDILVTGQTITAAAEAVHVTRPTVSEWVNHHPGFRTALNRRRQELWAEMTDSLRGLVPRALTVLEESLDGGDQLQAAVHVLKASGVYGAPPPSGPIDPEEFAIEERERVFNRALRGALSGS
jgi:hypothetical protein